MLKKKKNKKKKKKKRKEKKIVYFMKFRWKMHFILNEILMKFEFFFFSF